MQWPRCYTRRMDDRLLDATIDVLDEHGFTGLTLERVAERAGRSRVTLWRQNISQDALIDGLLARLTRDYRDAMWPAMAEAGTGADRLRSALDALFTVTDKHLHLLAVSDDMFHRAADRMHDITGQVFSFLDPFAAALRAGTADKSVSIDLPVDDAADALFNCACWGYVHLRHRHGWAGARARNAVAQTLNGMITPRQ
jgi:AcrR family transcriptional regulator